VRLTENLPTKSIIFVVIWFCNACTISYEAVYTDLSAYVNCVYIYIYISMPKITIIIITILIKGSVIIVIFILCSYSLIAVH